MFPYCYCYNKTLDFFLKYNTSDQSIMVDPLSYFSFHPVLHDWINKSHGMRYTVYGMVDIKDPLLLIRKNSLCSDNSRFHLLPS